MNSESNLYVCAALVLTGMLGHFVKKLHDLQQAGTLMSPLTYARMFPYTVAAGFMGGYLLAAAAWAMGQLNYMTAIFCGVLCSQGLDSLRARAAGKLAKEDEKPSP
jgi:hypothetical protein